MRFFATLHTSSLLMLTCFRHKSITAGTNLRRWIYSDNRYNNA